MEKLTARQEYILQVIKKLVAKNGYPPTVREIGAQAHLNSPATIHFHLTKLEEKGYIKKGNSKNRTIEILVPNEFVEKDEKITEEIAKNIQNSGINSVKVKSMYNQLPNVVYTSNNSSNKHL